MSRMPEGRRFKSMPVPFWFREASALSFRNMSTRPTDVFLSSAGKAGTTWVNKILYSLLFTYDDDGCVREGQGKGRSIGGSGQAYPSALPLNREEQERCLADPEDRQTGFSKMAFGDYTLEDLYGQEDPRLFSTHLYGTELLPIGLLGSIASGEDVDDTDTQDKEGHGRLIIVLRNLKDVMVSLHFFNGEAKDGWHGNEHGPGSFNRFLTDDTDNAFGSTFNWVKKQDELVTLLQDQAARNMGKQRVLVLYYEKLKADINGEIARINDFLDLTPLTDKKRHAVAEAVTFKSMKESKSSTTKVIMRKGTIGDWKNHLHQKDWNRFDEVFDRTLGTVPLAQPLLFYQLGGEERMGCPLNKKSEWTPDTDPRTWPAFRRMTLINGDMVPDNLITQKKGAMFIRPPSEYRGTIPSEEHPVEAGRYHVFASGICPWAQSVVSTMHLLGLNDVISLDIADGQSSRGWVYLDGTSVAPWTDRTGPFWLHEVYQTDDPNVSTRITVPVLWDKKTNKVVSNDSWTIVKILSNAFAGMGAPPTNASAAMAKDEQGHSTLTPSTDAEGMERVHSEIYDALLNGVYKAGIGHMRNGDVENDHVLAMRETVYSKLNELNDGVLAASRFLLGPTLTAVDVRLTMTLLRWDSSYRGAFFLGGGRGGILVGEENGYANLRAYVRDVFSMIKPVVDFCALRQYYRIRQSLKLAHRSIHLEEGKDEGEEGPLPPLADIREIIASAKEPAGSRPGMSVDSASCCFSKAYDCMWLM